MTQPPQSGGWPDPASTGQPPDTPVDPPLPAGPQPPAPTQPTGYDPYSPAAPFQPGSPGAGFTSDPGVPPAAAPYPPAGYPPPPPGYGYGYGHPPRQTNTLSIVALVLSLIGIGSCVTAPIGAIMGHVAMRQIRETGETGEGMAKAAIIVGWILTGLFALLVIAYIVMIVMFIGSTHAV